MGYKRTSSSLVLLSLFLRFPSKVTNIITLIFTGCWFFAIGRCHGNRVSKEWQIFSSILSLFFNISIFPRWNFSKLSYLVKMIWPNILQVKKYGSFRRFHRYHVISYFLAIKLNCSDRFSSKTDISKIAFVSQNVQSLKKIPRRKREKIHC